MEDFEIAEMKGLLLLDTFTNYNKTADKKYAGSSSSIVKVLVLMAPREGTYTIPEATAIINGRRVKTSRFEVTVGSQNSTEKKGLDIAVPTEANSIISSDEDVDDKIRKHVFIRVETNKPNCFAGEGVTVTYKLFSALEARSTVLKRPAFPGASVLEMVDRYDSTAEVELLDGKPYYVNLIRKVHLFPLQSGKLLLDDAEVLCTARLRRSGTGQYFSRSLALHAQPASLMVADPPLKGKPEGFNGAIGKFNLSITASDTHPLPRTLVKIQVRLLGQGNFPLLLCPKVQWPAGLFSGEPQTREVFDAYRFPLIGYKEFEYTITAPDTGSFLIGPVQFSYYDPIKGSYEKATSGSIQLPVSTLAASAIKKDPVAPGQGWPLQYYWFGVVLILVLGVLAHQFLLAGKERNEKPLVALEEEVPKPMKDHLLEARMAFYNEEFSNFSKLLLSGCWSFYEEEWQLASAQHMKTVLEAKMQEKKLLPQTRVAMLNLLSECERLAYTAEEVSAEKCKQLMEDAEQLLQEHQSVNL